MRFEVKERHETVERWDVPDHRLPLRMQAAGRERADWDRIRWTLWWRGFFDPAVWAQALRATAGWIMVQFAILRAFAAAVPWLAVVVPSLTLLAAGVSVSSTCVRTRARRDQMSRN